MTLIKWQLGLASTAVLLAAAGTLAGFQLKGLWRLFPAKRSALKWHRCCGWLTFALYAVISVSCLSFHFPLSSPLRAFDYGWFTVHPLNGFLGIAFYAAKILTVRKWKKGWLPPGLYAGLLLFLFWLVQFGTVVPAFFRFMVR